MMMMMMKGNLMVDESLSVLTCTSGEILTRNEITTTGPMYSHQSSASTNQPLPLPPSPLPPPPSKRKRNLPGNPDPEAEVIALSPKSLLATNRFICEICKKGFQRDQNLQLHRRGHNLPWKLKQRGNKEVRKKVYVCPEPTCVHHHPSRALGDLTGIKKHFCRKHGEKKWKCEKCSKRYAVQSDWKAHSKICGTKEYRCDCGTLFSRRDSFITHRAFCNALAQESTNFNNNNPTPKTSLNFPSISPHFPLKFEHQDPFFPSSQNPNNPTSIGFGLPGPGPGPGQPFASCPAWELNNNHNNNNSCPAEIAPLFHHVMGFEEASFEEALNGILMNNNNRGNNKDGGKNGGAAAAGDITRDFLGLRPVAGNQPDHPIFQNHEMINNDMSNLDSPSPSTFGLHQNQNTTCWRHN
ncbi:zinc finger protein BALDIBIS-like [Benincasa hispida]|uniref:zinc finger protein BALDIBIS-like n=1 Tax=Benincasa hispida TaxID=102211 RepID=UPI0018FF56B7|nr:zinc finger protein BALDIBIS-like [Benincasa hispida]XP_038899204.1 zinc finger protein BALDIBIS-like [Benincasa hispida]XP_038899205.1 zinc finger protein BALDIBIS-like [Benincasa hispida]